MQACARLLKRPKNPATRLRPENRLPMASDLHLEHLTLRLLCVGTPQGSLKDVLVPLLRDYRWHWQLHQIIFNAIVVIPSDDPATLRQLLPAKLTRMGFPDVEWEEIFTEPLLSTERAVEMVRQMTAAS
jgi:hypothetical protein